MTQGPKSPSGHSLSLRHLQSRRDRSLDSLVKGGFTCPMFQPWGTGTSLLKPSCFTLGKLLIWRALRLSDLLFSVHLGTKLPAMLSHFDMWYWLTYSPQPKLVFFLVAVPSVASPILTFSSPLTFSSVCFSISLLCPHLGLCHPPELLNLEPFSGLSLHQRKTSSCILRPYHS